MDRLLEIESDRSLHDARSSCRNDGSKSRIRLLEIRRANVCQRAGSFRIRRARVVDDQTIGNAGVDVTEIRMVENIVNLPAKLQRVFLAELDGPQTRDISVVIFGMNAQAI